MAEHIHLKNSLIDRLRFYGNALCSDEIVFLLVGNIRAVVKRIE